VNPLNDVAFKRTFGSEDAAEVTIAFLNSVMGLVGDVAIQALAFTHREFPPQLLEGRGARLDVLVTTGNGELVNTEVQVSNHHGMERRSLYY
jgi:predicted transposase/invertase (TIGR01784 family)